MSSRTDGAGARAAARPCGAASPAPRPRATPGAPARGPRRRRSRCSRRLLISGSAPARRGGGTSGTAGSSSRDVVRAVERRRQRVGATRAWSQLRAAAELPLDRRSSGGGTHWAREAVDAADAREIAARKTDPRRSACSVMLRSRQECTYRLPRPWRTLDDHRRATLEDTGADARRVLGGAHPAPGRALRTRARLRAARRNGETSATTVSRAGDGMPRAPVYMSFFFWIHAATWRPHETGTQSEPAM